MSVAVCAYNAAPTLRKCLQAVRQLEYPNYEVIVVDDGSNDGTAGIAKEYGVQLVSTPNRGLSAARNTALEVATGEIIAYLDSDAYPEPDWLDHVARTFMRSQHVGVGGPNLVPVGAGIVEQSVASAPGGPNHVMLNDTEAEHIPGCNMAFRRKALMEIGGFDPMFRIAGDDVDICWRLQERGGTLGFSPGAMVWHHRRDSVRAYAKQQFNYGRAEAMLERKWPEKYSRFGHPAWAGQLYGTGGADRRRLRQWRVYHGVWGTAPFQALYGGHRGTIPLVTAMPEWYLAIGGLALLSVLGFFWAPLLIALPLFLLALVAPVVQAFGAAAKQDHVSVKQSLSRSIEERLLVAALHVLQPMARLWGRLSTNSLLWPSRIGRWRYPRWQVLSHWSENWRSPESWLSALESTLRTKPVVVRRGGECDRWDLEVWCRVFGGVRLRAVTEEHGWGKQLVRLRVWPRVSRASGVSAIVFGVLSILAGFQGSWYVCAALAVWSVALIGRMASECGTALGLVEQAVDGWSLSGDQKERSVDEIGDSALWSEERNGGYLAAAPEEAEVGQEAALVWRSREGSSAPRRHRSWRSAAQTQDLEHGTD